MQSIGPNRPISARNHTICFSFLSAFDVADDFLSFVKVISLFSSLCIWSFDGHIVWFHRVIVCFCLFLEGKSNFVLIYWKPMAAPPARARADYDYLIKLLLIGDSGIFSILLLLLLLLLLFLVVVWVLNFCVWFACWKWEWKWEVMWKIWLVGCMQCAMGFEICFHQCDFEIPCFGGGKFVACSPVVFGLVLLIWKWSIRVDLSIYLGLYFVLKFGILGMLCFTFNLLVECALVFCVTTLYAWLKGLWSLDANKGKKQHFFSDR